MIREWKQTVADTIFPYFYVKYGENIDISGGTTVAYSLFVLSHNDKILKLSIAVLLGEEYIATEIDNVERFLKGCHHSGPRAHSSNTVNHQTYLVEKNYRPNANHGFPMHFD